MWSGKNHIMKGGENMIDAEWIAKAVEAIQSGLCDKLTKDNIIVYRVVNIIRIDIKDK